MQVAPDLFAVLVFGQGGAVDRMHRQTAAFRVQDADDPIAGDRTATRREMQGHALGQPAAAHIEARACPAFDPPLSGGGVAVGGFQAREDDVQHLGRGDTTAADGFEQVVLGSGGEPVQGRAQGDVSPLLAGPLEGLVHRGAAQTDELVLLALADMPADGRPGPARDGERTPVRRHDGFGAANDLHHVAVLQQGAKGAQLAIDLHADAGVAHIGVDRIGEVQRHGAPG